MAPIVNIHRAGRIFLWVRNSHDILSVSQRSRKAFRKPNSQVLKIKCWSIKQDDLHPVPGINKLLFKKYTQRATGLP